MYIQLTSQTHVTPLTMNEYFYSTDLILSFLVSFAKKKKNHGLKIKVQFLLAFLNIIKNEWGTWSQSLLL